jgi:CDP-diacylglycerol--glycerol-3-phosphate 3-phosphatidyltransferase
VPLNAEVVSPQQDRANKSDQAPKSRLTFTGIIGAICWFPLKAIISLCVALRIHPNVLTLVGVIINIGAAWALGFNRFVLAGVVMICANIFDFIDGKVAHELQLQSSFGAFWDSTLDRFSDLALLTGLIYLYSSLGRTDYVMWASLTLIFSIMTSYARARAESLVTKCKVGFMERPERIVLFMIGAFTNRMAGVLWVILTLSVLTVANRIYYTYLALNRAANASEDRAARRIQPRVLLDRRANHCPLRPVGHHDPGLRLAGAARLVEGSDRVRPRTARSHRPLAVASVPRAACPPRVFHFVDTRAVSSLAQLSVTWI